MNLQDNRPVTRNHRRNRSNSRSRGGQRSRVLEYFFHAGHNHFVCCMFVKVMRDMGKMGECKRVEKTT